MTRPSRGIDQKLLDAGQSLVAEKGFSALTVRAAATRAGVNPAMFHYHFKSKRVFKRQVLINVYEEFFKGFALATRGGDPLSRLNQALRYLARFARDHRREALSLVLDALNGDPDTIQFIRDHFLRHIRVILDLAAEAQKAGDLAPAPLPFVGTFLMGGIGVPSLLVESFRMTKTNRPFGHSRHDFEESLITDEAIERRVKAVLRGLGSKR